MKDLIDYKEKIHSCSKCGLCQSVCPIYKITGNDCTVSRGHFIMLQGLINGDLQMSRTINKYLDLCLKCNACSKFCPSGIDIIDIISAAKHEYFKTSIIENLISLIQKPLFQSVKLLSHIIPKQHSKTFAKKIVYFEGCGEVFRSKRNVIKLLNKCNIEVISPNFNCCGIPFFVRGDFETYKKLTNHNLEILKQYKDLEIVTTCASCEKTLKKLGANVKNIFEYIKENNLKFSLKKQVKVTFHKPCNMDNFSDIKWVFNNTNNLEYIEMQDFDKCCGLNGISKPQVYKIMSKIFKEKRNNIIKTNSNIVLTSCPGCELTLNLIGTFKYKVQDLTEFLAQNI